MVVAVLILNYPFRVLAGVIVGTKQDEDKVDFLFLLGAGIYD